MAVTRLDLYQHLACLWPRKWPGNEASQQADHLLGYPILHCTPWTPPTFPMLQNGHKLKHWLQFFNSTDFCFQLYNLTFTWPVTFNFVFVALAKQNQLSGTGLRLQRLAARDRGRQKHPTLIPFVVKPIGLHSVIWCSFLSGLRVSHISELSGPLYAQPSLPVISAVTGSVPLVRPTLVAGKCHLCIDGGSPERPGVLHCKARWETWYCLSDFAGFNTKGESWQNSWTCGGESNCRRQFSSKELLAVLKQSLDLKLILLIYCIYNLFIHNCKSNGHLIR